jgi:hypothetical protein
MCRKVLRVKLLTFRLLSLQGTSGKLDFSGFLRGACKPIYLNLNKRSGFVIGEVYG